MKAKLQPRHRALLETMKAHPKQVSSIAGWNTTGRTMRFLCRRNLAKRINPIFEAYHITKKGLDTNV